MQHVKLQPKLSPPALRKFNRLVRDLGSAHVKADAGARSRAILDFRASVRTLYSLPSTTELELLVALHIVADLVEQGWTVSRDGNGLGLVPPESEGVRHKDEVRRSHLVERDAQLMEPSVQQFVSRMERKRLTPSGWCSVFSLMRDGRELAQGLERVLPVAEGESRLGQLETLISPYIQFVETGAVCPHTGYLLSDIWRYFRHTWTTAYRSVPGRCIMILVRDAAAPCHPVIGIAALGSAVLQQAVRDRWIGWDTQSFLKRLEEMPAGDAAGWIKQNLESQLSSLFILDLLQDGTLTEAEMFCPTHATIERVIAASAKAMEMHRLHPQKDIHKGLDTVPKPSEDLWERRAMSHLFRAKRCKALATLLNLKVTLADCIADGARGLQSGLQSKRVREAIARLLRYVKAEHAGIGMMDITVCGSIAPYNVLLGGKLVASLLMSAEVTRYYNRRYAKQPSIIASSMAGKEVIRRPNLVLLTTTGLYASGASQYNRITVPAQALGEITDHDLRYTQLGYSVGYGSFHFSSETVSAIEVLLSRTKGGRRVNSIFGEGVNPLLRKIREALDLLGMPSDQLLQHGNRRVVYGIPLASNYREVLVGMQTRPQYFVKVKDAEASTKSLARFWASRWLSGRIARDGVLEAVRQHSLDYPVNHGGRVRLPNQDSGSLFDEVNQ